MKKVLSGILIFVAVLQIGGITPFYFYFMQLVKDQAKVSLSDKNDLEKITVSISDFNNPALFQKTGDNEFNWKGTRYDFQSVVRQGSDYVFYGLADQKESLLVKILTNDFQQTGSKNKGGKNMLKDFFKDIVICANQNMSAAHTELNAPQIAPYHATLCEGFRCTIPWPPDHV